MIFSNLLFSIRVRYAPSPTGFMHLGNLRIALYNYLYAKLNGGQFILRIEDTDRTRFVQSALDNICHILNWSWLVPDEGPGYGGDFGPYTQSTRLKIYKEYIEKLIFSKNAYRCFCTDERLLMLKSNTATSNYDGKCQTLKEKEIIEKLNQNIPYCVRFKLSPHVTSYNDMIYGKINQNVFDFEGDPIILKSDKYPTYHFANVVDDHLMRISHVIRGSEWMSSTIKHIMIHEAFGWSAPAYAHLPLIFNGDGTKLSKRNNDLQINRLIDDGYYPEALLNFITLGSGGFAAPRSPGLSQAKLPPTLSDKLKSRSQMIRNFSIGLVRTVPLKVDFGTLDDLNKKALNVRIREDSAGAAAGTTPTLVGQLRHHLANRYGTEMAEGQDDLHLTRIIRWAGSRIHSLKVLTDGEYSYLWYAPDQTRPTAVSSHTLKICKKFLERLILATAETPLISCELNSSRIDGSILGVTAKEVLAFSGQNGGDRSISDTSELFGYLRLVLTGIKKGPSIRELLHVLGTGEALRRINLSLHASEATEDVEQSIGTK